LWRPTTGQTAAVRLLTLPGVFRPVSDSWMLARALREEPLPADARVLDVCTGSGLLAITAALRGADVTAIDVSRRAVTGVRLNARLNGVRIRALRGDLLAPVAGETFDLIVSNPPYVPAETDELPTRGRARAWDAGREGRAFLDPLLAEAPRHLRPGGVLLLVHSSIIGYEPTRRPLADRGLEVEIVARARGPLGPLASARVGHLEGQGLISPGQRDEDLFVIRARRPAAAVPAAPLQSVEGP
jgi:release factor glutamine methyltransferase